LHANKNISSQVSNLKHCYYLIKYIFLAEHWYWIPLALDIVDYILLVVRDSVVHRDWCRGEVAAPKIIKIVFWSVFSSPLLEIGSMCPGSFNNVSHCLMRVPHPNRFSH